MFPNIADENAMNQWSKIYNVINPDNYKGE